MTTTPSATPQLGDEMPAPGGRTLRVVHLRDGFGTCARCALDDTRLNHCYPSYSSRVHPFDCSRLPKDCIPVFVDDIPLLTLKGILS